MEELLKQLLGKKIDVTCGTNAAFRGDVIDVKSGVLYLRDEDEKVAYVAIDKIAVVYECPDGDGDPGRGDDVRAAGSGAVGKEKEF